MICKGIITDLIGQPIPKAIITIKSIRGATSITSSVYFHQCNDKGEYNFSLLKGKYKIWVQNSNFSDKNLVGVGIVESDTPDGDIDSILVAEVDPTPDEPITPSGCECTWVTRTLIPTYFYITLDSTADGLTDSEVAEIIKNTDVTVISYEGYGRETAGIPKQYPLMYLGKTEEGYKYAFPYSISDAQDSADYSTGHEKCILIQLHNRLSQYNTEGSSYIHGLTRTNGTTIYRDSYGVGGKWPATNKIMLSLAASDYQIRPDLISEYTPQDTAKVYYYKHIDNGIEAVPMTFEFLETVRQCTTEVEDKPEDTPNTPDNITPEGVLTARTVKVRFTPDYWYVGDAKYAVYCFASNGEGFWKEAVKVEDNVVWYTFTEEEVNSEYVYIFTRHNLEGDVDWYTKLNQTTDIVITFDDTVRNDVVTIDETNTTGITVGSAYI